MPTWGAESRTAPQVPTRTRARACRSDVTTWQAIFLPKDTPETIVRRLNQAISETLDTPSVRDRFKSIGEEVTVPERRGPEYLAKFVVSEIERWSRPSEQAAQPWTNRNRRSSAGYSIASVRRTEAQHFALFSLMEMNDEHVT